jgi:hypothetical protein
MSAQTKSIAFDLSQKGIRSAMASPLLIAPEPKNLRKPPAVPLNHVILPPFAVFIAAVR